MDVRDATPKPHAFNDTDGFYSWRELVNRDFSIILCDLIKARFNNNNNSAAGAMRIMFKLVEARGLVTKEGGKPRDAYCKVHIDSHHNDVVVAASSSVEESFSSPLPPPEVFETKVITATNTPVWNQGMPLSSSSISDDIIVEVLDNRKDDYLGCVAMNVGELMATCSKTGTLARWYSLARPLPEQVASSSSDSNNSKKRAVILDRFIGGEILIEASLIDNEVR